MVEAAAAAVAVRRPSGRTTQRSTLGTVAAGTRTAVVVAAVAAVTAVVAPLPFSRVGRANLFERVTTRGAAADVAVVVVGGGGVGGGGGAATGTRGVVVVVAVGVDDGVGVGAAHDGSDGCWTTMTKMDASCTRTTRRGTWFRARRCW